MTTLASTIRAIARRSGYIRCPGDTTELVLAEMQTPSTFGEGPARFVLMERSRSYRDDTPACRDPRRADGSRIPAGTVLLRSEVEAVVRALLVDDEPIPEPRPWREERGDRPFSRTLRM